MKYSDFMVPANEAQSSVQKDKNTITVKWGKTKVAIKTPISKEDMDTARKYTPTDGVDDFNVNLIRDMDLTFVIDNWDEIIKMIERAYQRQFKTTEHLSDVVIPCRIDYDWNRLPNKGAVLIEFMERNTQFNVIAVITTEAMMTKKQLKIQQLDRLTAKRGEFNFLSKSEIEKIETKYSTFNERKNKALIP